MIQKLHPCTHCTTFHMEVKLFDKKKVALPVLYDVPNVKLEDNWHELSAKIVYGNDGQRNMEWVHDLFAAGAFPDAGKTGWQHFRKLALRRIPQIRKILKG
jgi:hypothetical protein